MNNISTIRRRERITQAQLGAELGWSQARISNYESGSRVPSLADSRSIVRALNALGAVCVLDEVFPPEAGASEAA